MTLWALPEVIPPGDPWIYFKMQVPWGQPRVNGHPAKSCKPHQCRIAPGGSFFSPLDVLFIGSGRPPGLALGQAVKTAIFQRCWRVSREALLPLPSQLHGDLSNEKPASALRENEKKGTENLKWLPTRSSPRDSKLCKIDQHVETKRKQSNVLSFSPSAMFIWPILSSPPPFLI